MKKALLVLLLLCSIVANAQEVKQVLIEITPNDAFLKINGQLYEVKDQPRIFTIDLKPGKYPIQIWAPKFELFEDVLIVKPEGITKYTKGLVTRSQEYLEYREELAKYKTENKENIGIKAAIIGANILALWYVIDGGSISELNQLQGELDDLRTEFTEAITVNTINAARSSYELTRNEYDDKRSSLNTRRLVGIPTSIVLGYFSYKYITRKKKGGGEGKPTYEESNPLVLQKIDFNFLPDSGFSFQFSFNF